MNAPRWDVIVEPDEDGFTFDAKTGAIGPVPKGTLRVRYRKLGSRGRRETFVVVGGFGKRSVFDIVDAYERKRKGTL